MSENETIQTIQISEGFVRWLMMNRLGMIYKTERLINTLKEDLNKNFNIDCYDVIIGYRDERDIYSEIKDNEIIFSHGLVSILIKCDTTKILIQSKGVLLETRKKSYIMLYSIGNVFIK